MKYIWNQPYIEYNGNKMRELVDEVKELENNCKQIVKRQEALSIKQSSFPTLNQLRNKIKPFVQLWDAIIQFN